MDASVKNSTPLPDFQGKPTGKSFVNKTLGVVLGLLVVGAIVVVAFLVSSSMGLNQQQVPTAPAQVVVPSVAVSPTPKDEEEEAATIDVGDVEKDLQDVQKDAQGL